MKRDLQEDVYLVQTEDVRVTIEKLEQQPGVLTVQPSGADLHLFVNAKLTSPEKLQASAKFEFKKIEPSLEDVFIAHVRRDEAVKRAA